MAQITLRKALNLKNKLAGELSRLQMRLYQHNVVRSDRCPDYNADAVLSDYEITRNQLVELKNAIAQANLPIYEAITRVAELKATVKVLESVPTNQPSEMNIGTDQNPKIITHRVVISQKEIDKKISMIEAEIQKLNDEIDYHNGTTKIEFGE